MGLALRLHPDSHCDAATGVAVELERPRADSLLLHYVVTGRIGDLRLPPAAVPVHADELWRTTCFEAFVRTASGDEYYEFNFSPSTQWAAYRFSGYRAGRRVAEGTDAPAIHMQSAPLRLTLRASLALDRLAGLPRGMPWRLGLSAVIEEANGRQSHWALAHPPGKADFHHADCFAHELPPA
jgi:hypothetical protein